MSTNRRLRSIFAKTSDPTGDGREFGVKIFDWISARPPARVYTSFQNESGPIKLYAASSTATEDISKETTRVKPKSRSRYNVLVRNILRSIRIHNQIWVFFYNMKCDYLIYYFNALRISTKLYIGTTFFSK